MSTSNVRAHRKYEHIEIGSSTWVQAHRKYNHIEIWSTSKVRAHRKYEHIESTSTSKIRAHRKTPFYCTCHVDLDSDRALIDDGARMTPPLEWQDRHSRQLGRFDVAPWRSLDTSCFTHVYSIMLAVRGGKIRSSGE